MKQKNKDLSKEKKETRIVTTQCQAKERLEREKVKKKEGPSKIIGKAGKGIKNVGCALYSFHADPRIFWWTQGCGAYPKMVGGPTHGFSHGFRTLFLGHYGFFPLYFVDLVKGTMVMF